MICSHTEIIRQDMDTFWIHRCLECKKRLGYEYPGEPLTWGKR